ncbi:MAG: MMPL family transporter, partial [Myxococcota bacterium]|nr:MMPL family transporter [Myxococcota bacterium]
SAERLGDGLAAVEAEYTRHQHPGLRLVLVQMARDPNKEPVGRNGVTEIEVATRQALEGLGVEGSFAGLGAISEQDQAQVLRRVRILTPLSLAAVLLVLLFVERRPIRLLTVAAPMLLALGGTLGLVGLIAGKITIIEAFFGMLVFGLGVDFALHLIVRLREEQAGGHTFDEALPRTIAGTGTGIVVGALTTAGAFFVAAVAPDPVAFHLGLSGGIGLLLCLLLMLTLLPALWTLLDRRTPAAPPSAMVLPLLRPLTRLASRHPWVVLAVAAAVVAGALAGSGRFHYQDNLAKVFSRNVPALETQDRIQELFGLNSYPWVSTAETLEEARRLVRAYEADPTFPRVESAASLLPADLPERAAVLAAAAPAIESRRQLLEAMQSMPMGFNAGAARAGLELLATLEQAAAAGPPGVDDLPEVIRAQFLSPDGEILVYA